jgi:hypothetical protein
VVKHYRDLQSIADYPVKVRKLIRRCVGSVSTAYQPYSVKSGPASTGLFYGAVCVFSDCFLVDGL